MRIGIEFEISNELLEQCHAIDVEAIEKEHASRRIAETLLEKFPPIKLGRNARLERGLPPVGITGTERYENELYVYDRGQVESMLGEIRTLKQFTHNRQALEILDHIRSIILT